MTFVVGASVEIDLSDSEQITYDLAVRYDYDSDDYTYHFEWSRYYMDWEDRELTRRDREFDGSSVEDTIDDLAVGETEVEASLTNGMPEISLHVRLAWD
jgi:hypothetical protein